MHHLCEAGVGTFMVTPQRQDLVLSAYALKVVPESAHAASRSAREFASLRRINERHLVNYRDTGIIRHDHNEYRWLAMDFVHGTALAHLLDAGPKLDVFTAVRLFEGGVAGAVALWEMEIAHRAITPANLVITPAGDLVLVDLGPAYGTEQNEKGKPFLADPVNRNRSTEGWLADQFDLGVVGDRIVQSVGAFDHEAGGQAETASPRPGLDGTDAARKDLTRVVTKMLAPRPADRYQDWRALQSELADIRSRHVEAESRWQPPADLQGPACYRPSS